MESPVIVKSIPPQVINEQGAYGPFNLAEFITTADKSAIQFQAELKGGGSLPQGMICTGDGILTGIPAKGTQGSYEIVLTAQNDAGAVQTTFTLSIKPSLAGTGEADYFSKLKTQIWEALEQHLPVPDFAEMYDKPITSADIYYLLERWGVLTIWNAYDLEPPGEKKPLILEGMSEHYDIFDRGSSLVACPKDLFSHERTLEDGLRTARAMAREVFKRNWTIEMAGFDKLMRAVWVEVQQIGDQLGRHIEVINYSPSPADLKLYSARAQTLTMTKGLE